LGALAHTPAIAQDAAVEEVVVTAQRREQSLQEVPIAVTAITSNALDRAGVSETGQLTQLTPSLSMTRTNIQVTPFIRGIGTTNAAPGNEMAVATYIDGVYLLSAQASLFTFNNIERIEVLRGPQGTLFGRNATGGLIQIVTKDPTHTPSGHFAATLENYDTQTVQGYVTGGLTDDLAASIAITGRRQGNGYGHNITLDRDTDRTNELGGRFELQYVPTDRLDLNFAADFNVRNGDVGLNRTGAPGTRLINGQLAPDDPRTVLGNVKSRGYVRDWGLALRANYELTDDLTLTSISAYRRTWSDHSYDQDATPLRIVDVRIQGLDQTWQQEMFLNGRAGPLDFTTGVFFLRTVSSYKPNRTTAAAPGPLNVERYGSNVSESYAAYGQATYALTPTTNITAGLRYTYEEKRVEGQQLALFGHPDGAGNIATATSLVAPVEEDYQKLTWRVSIDQKLGDGLLVYASANRGYKSGGFSIVNLVQPALKPEVLDSYEAGLKSQWFDNQLRLNIAGYYYDYSNLQVTQVVAGGTLTVNAAKAEAKGVEIETEFSPRLDFGRLNIRGSAAYAWGEYTDFPGGPVLVSNPYTAPPPGVTCPTPSNASAVGNTTCNAQLKGFKLVRMPKWTVSIGAEYAFPLGDGELSLSGDYYFSDKYYFDPDNILAEDGYSIVNLQVAYAIRDGDVRFRAFGRNLGDTTYFIQGSRQALGDIISVGPPRTYGVGVDFRF
jgi:iron complex outermembrane receptor protein